MARAAMARAWHHGAVHKRFAIAGAIGVVTCALGLSAMRMWPSAVLAEADESFAATAGALRADGEALASGHTADAAAPRVEPEAAPAPDTSAASSTLAPEAADVDAQPVDTAPDAAALANAARYDRVAGQAVADIAWLPAGPRRCTRRGRRRYCDGPLRAPRPQGEAAARAIALGLGGREAWFRALSVEEPPAAWLEVIPERASSSEDLLWPVPEGFLGRGFGQQLHGNPQATPHPGLDMPAAAGAEVHAADDGLVVYAGNERHGYGNVVLLMHRGGYVTLYAHCSALHVFAGQVVERGARLGEVGKTGLAHGNHLHFEWRRRGHARNPRRHFVGRPDHAAERRLANEQRARRRDAEAHLALLRARAEAHLALLRARAERNAARRARRAARDPAPSSP